MRKSFIIIGIVFMLSGCSFSDSADISETYAAESIESGRDTAEIPNESQAVADSAPAGISSPETSQPDYAGNDSNGSVSLVKGEYDNIKEMVSFEGEFVPFEALGYKQYVYESEQIAEDDLSIKLFGAADKELLYFFEYDFMGAAGRKFLNVYEYNLLTGTSERISMAEDCSDILYIDREYILYYSAPEYNSPLSAQSFYLTDRAAEETIAVNALTTPFQTRFDSKIVRCGDYLFFTRPENVGTADGSFSETADVLVRYSLTRKEAEVVKAAELLGAIENEVIIAPFGSRLEQMYYTLDSVSFAASPDSLYLGGGQMGYIVPTDRSSLFGERYEVGKLIPSRDGNIVKPILTTNYGTSVSQFLITSQSAAAVQVRGENSSELLIIDTTNKRAAAYPYYENQTGGGYITGDGEWIYFSLLDDSIIAAINTAR